MPRLFRGSTKNIIILVFLLAFAARIFGIFYRGNYKAPDMEEFSILAKNMLAGGGFSYYRYDPEVGYNVWKGKLVPSAYVPIGYPLLLTGFFYLFGMNTGCYLAILIFQAILGAILCVLLYLIGKEAFSDKVSLLAAFVLAVFPVFIFMNTEYTATNLYIALNYLLILLLLIAVKRPRIGLFILCGLMMGLGILSRSQMVVYFPFLAVWLLVKLGKKAFVPILVFVLTTIMCVTPWVARNYLVFKKAPVFTVITGFVLWRGHNEEAIGTGRLRDGRTLAYNAEIKKEISEIPFAPDYEIRKDRIYFDHAIRYIKNNPLRSFVILPIRKFLYYWLIDITDELTWHPLYWVPYFTILPFFILGLFHSLKEPAKYLIFYIYFMIGTAMNVVFSILARYRVFIEPLIVLFAAYGFFKIVEIVKKRLPQQL